MASTRGTAAKTNDRRAQAAYPIAEAARYLRVPPATVRSWILGRPYTTAGGARRSSAVVDPASRRPPLLSFWNLIECHVLRALRTQHGVPLRKVREALAYAEKKLGIEHLLRRKDLLAGAGRLFLDRYGELIDLSASSQIAMRKVFETHLGRVEWDDWKFPVRLYPFVSAEAPGMDRSVTIDPAVAFGRPILAGYGVTTAVLAERVDAGETIDAIAADYDLSPEEVERAILYERAA